MTHELRNDDQGRYLVTTATGSRYGLDLIARTVRRHVAASPPIVHFLEAGFSQLRRDGKPVELLMLETCTVGASARYWLQVRRSHPHAPDVVAGSAHRARNGILRMSENIDPAFFALFGDWHRHLDFGLAATRSASDRGVTTRVSQPFWSVSAQPGPNSSRV